jgi:hypothetical protein
MLRGAIIMLGGARMLRYALAGVAAAAIATLVVFAGGSGASAASSAGGQERFTNYEAPTGPEISVQAAQERAVGYARSAAGITGALTVVSAHSSFARAHTLLMGEPADQAKAQETGPAERVEEMQSAVWVTKVTADNGGAISPNVPTPAKAKGPSGRALIIVADAHTGFTKEIYLGPSSPDLASLGQTTTVQVPADSVQAVASVRLNPRQGVIAGKLRPARVHVPVTLRNDRGHKVAVQRTLPRGAETAAGSFLFNELEGGYTLSAPGCTTQHVALKGHHEVTVTLHCAK